MSTDIQAIQATIRRLTDNLNAAHAKGDPGWPIVAELVEAYDALKEAKRGNTK